jgi:hypothetical protein
VILAHGNSPLAVAMSLLDQGSVVKVQFLAKKSDLLADCTKATLGRICLLTFSLFGISSRHGFTFICEDGQNRPQHQ